MKTDIIIIFIFFRQKGRHRCQEKISLLLSERDEDEAECFSPSIPPTLCPPTSLSAPHPSLLLNLPPALCFLSVSVWVSVHVDDHHSQKIIRYSFAFSMTQHQLQLKCSFINSTVFIVCHLEYCRLLLLVLADMYIFLHILTTHRDNNGI